MPRDTVSVAECDYLEEDADIRGQRYVCLSFLSPEKILDDKRVFTFTKFTEQFCSDVNELFSNMKEKYPDDADTFQTVADRYRFLFNKRHMQEEYKYYMDEKSEELDREFSETVDYQTNVRGIKVRGSYDSMREAQIRSEVLKRKDKNHNIFIAQVGCWCPWDPCADQIDDQHYGEDQLNTLMQKYKENQAHKDEVFDERKDKMLEAQKERNKKGQEENLLEAPDEAPTQAPDGTLEEQVNNSENEVLNTPGEQSGEQSGAPPSVVTNSGIGEDNTVQENYDAETNPEVNEKVFGEADPWLKSKIDNQPSINIENPEGSESRVEEVD